MTGQQWNLMIRKVNEGKPRKEVEKYFSKEEMKTYDRMCAQLAEWRKKDPRAAFAPVENEW